MVTNDGFKESLHIVQKDIVALFMAKSRINISKPFRRKYKKDDSDDDTFIKKPKKCENPNFITHFKDSAGVECKVGDKQEHGGKLLLLRCHDTP